MKSTSGVFNQYWESSIKVGERTRRGSSSLLEVHIHGPSPRAVGQIHRKSPKQGQPVRFCYNNDVPPRQGEYGNWQGRWANDVHHKCNLWRPGRAKVYHEEADTRLLLQLTRQVCHTTKLKDHHPFSWYWRTSSLCFALWCYCLRWAVVYDRCERSPPIHTSVWRQSKARSQVVKCFTSFPCPNRM